MTLDYMWRCNYENGDPKEPTQQCGAKSTNGFETPEAAQRSADNHSKRLNHYDICVFKVGHHGDPIVDCRFEVNTEDHFAHMMANEFLRLGHEKTYKKALRRAWMCLEIAFSDGQFGWNETYGYRWTIDTPRRSIQHKWDHAFAIEMVKKYIQREEDFEDY